MIIIAGRIRTLTSDRPHARAIAIKDGLIAAVGDEANVREWRGADTTVLDLGDATLTPGLVDGHTHPVLGTRMASGIDLSSCTDLDAVRALVADAARGTERGGWVSGFGLDHNAFGGRAIHSDMIDDVLGGVPACLHLYDGHSALVSSEALRIAGITGPREFAQRSTIVCDADGRPTGHLLENAAMTLVSDLVPVPDAATRNSRLQALLGDMAAVGLTGGHVMDLEGDALALLADIEDTDDLPMRLRLAPWCMPGVTDEQLDDLVRAHGTAGRRWHIGAVKFFIDGTVEGGSAWLDHADCHGEGTLSLWRDPADFSRVVRRLAAARIQTATHAIGDAGVRHVLDSLQGIDTGGTRHRIEHIESLSYEQAARFAPLGVTASMQPTHVAYTRADHTDAWSTRLGRERADRAWCCRDMRDTGANLVLGSDWPIAHYDPREVLATSRLRRLPGQPDTAPVAPGQALTGLMALEAMTVAAAYAAGEEAHAGRIAPGFRADLTAFELDPVTCPPDELAEAPVRLTVVDGNITHRA
jgi:predicted amidohydrolase YtcJ